MNEIIPITYRDTVALPDDTTLQNAASITDDLRGHGSAELNAEAGTVTFQFEAEDLWAASDTAHGLARMLEERGVSYEVTRDCIVMEDGLTTLESRAASA